MTRTFHNCVEARSGLPLKSDPTLPWDMNWSHWPWKDYEIQDAKGAFVGVNVNCLPSDFRGTVISCPEGSFAVRPLWACASGPYSRSTRGMWDYIANYSEARADSMSAVDDTVRPVGWFEWALVVISGLCIVAVVMIFVAYGVSA